jgi:hypothetical protein
VTVIDAARIIPANRQATVTLGATTSIDRNRILLGARAPDGRLFDDYFSFAVVPGQASEVVIAFQETFGECVRLELATGALEQSAITDVSPFVPLDQIPRSAPSPTVSATPIAPTATPSEAPTPTPTPSRTPTPTSTSTPANPGTPTVTATATDQRRRRQPHHRRAERPSFPVSWSSRRGLPPSLPTV